MHTQMSRSDDVFSEREKSRGDFHCLFSILTFQTQTIQPSYYEMGTSYS